MVPVALSSITHQRHGLKILEEAHAHYLAGLRAAPDHLQDFLARSDLVDAPVSSAAVIHDMTDHFLDKAAKDGAIGVRSFSPSRSLATHSL